jgi:hypothetical protein
VCPPNVDPHTHPTCLQPWQQQLETWHERQQWQPGNDAGLGASSSANGGLLRADSPAVSLSTTMTSCMDADDAAMQAQAQQQQQAVVSPCGVLGQS